MRHAILIGGAVTLLLFAIGAASAADGDALCGLGPSDWCAAPEGDPCGRHLNEAACRADPACFGMQYRGESVVPCQWDERGFAPNCPAVGCTSTPPRE
jgi:hypothetical protein